jgi:hypothetical protein
LKFSKCSQHYCGDAFANGTAFDLVLEEEMISRYGKKQSESANQGKGQEHEQPAPECCVVMVYRNFNMEQFMVHVIPGTSAAVKVAARAERQQQGNDDEV